MLGHTRWASVGHHLPGQRPPAQQRGARAASTGPYVTAALNGDVDNFADLKAAEGLRIAAEITTDAKVIPTLVSRRLGRRASSRSRRSAGPWPRFDGSVAIARQRGRRPRRAAPRPAGQRPGAVRRPGRGRLRRGQRALRRGRGDRRATSAWTARRRPIPTTRRSRARSSCSTAPAPARSTASRRSPTTAPSCRSPTTSSPTAEITTRDIDRGDSPHFLLKEISEAPGVVPQDAAGQARRARRRARASCSAPRRCRPTSRGRPARRRHPPGPGHRPGHRRGGRPEPGRAPWRRRCRHGRLAGRGAAGHRAVRLRAATTT